VTRSSTAPAPPAPRPPAPVVHAHSGKRPVLLLVVLLALLGGGGALFGAVVGGGPASSGVVTPSPASQTKLPVPGAPAQPIAASDAAVMGLVPAGGRAAPGFTLTDSRGAPVALASLDRGRSVVLTFMDDRCELMCPVLTGELAAAAGDLGSDAGRVQFVVVDLNPAAGGAARIGRYLAGQGRPLASLPHFTFLTGSPAALRRVWADYGIQSGVSPTGTFYTNETMWFIAPGGELRYQATPFANERPNGTWWLPAATAKQWERGIAHYATASL
jgi:cytochrome oxidase Cu insertion factor (SCO1/SenC/PrrC family)